VGYALHIYAVRDTAVKYIANTDLLVANSRQMPPPPASVAIWDRTSAVAQGERLDHFLWQIKAFLPAFQVGLAGLRWASSAGTWCKKAGACVDMKLLTKLRQDMRTCVCGHAIELVCVCVL